jgi:hypothetical protein
VGDSKVKLTNEIYLPGNGPLDAPERIKGIRNKATCLGEVVESGTLRGPGRNVPSIGGVKVMGGEVLADMGEEDIPIR